MILIKQRAKAFRVKPRRHKGITFMPTKRFTTKREAKNFLVKSGYAYTHFFRIYHDKPPGSKQIGKRRHYTVYVAPAPQKLSHGGIRIKPTRKVLTARKLRKQGLSPQLTRAKKQVTFTQIKTGKNKGNYLRSDNSQLYPQSYVRTWTKAHPGVRIK